MIYTYYAFISYSRKDKSYAKYLQNRLENYRYPISLVREAFRPNDKKYLRKIFRDTSDLDATQGNFTEAICRHIAGSRYLIVICSPNSARSAWVGHEIDYFLETHNHDMKLIFPIIADGEVPECLPEKLRCPEMLNRNIPTMIPDDTGSQKEGWEHGFLQLTGCLLSVSFEKIADRFQKAKQAFLRKIIAVITAVLAIAVALTIWALHAEHKAEIAKEQALYEAKVAEGTLNFLEKAFDSADATKNGDKNMTLMTFAKKTAKNLDAIPMPEVRLKVAMIILPMIAGMGDPSTATANFEHLIPEAKKTLKSKPNYLFIFYYKYAELLIRNDENRKALAILNELYGWSSRTRRSKEIKADLLNRMAAAYSYLNMSEKALECLAREEQLRGGKSSESQLAKANIYNNLGVSYKEQGNYDKAYKCFKLALEFYASDLGTQHPNYSAALGNFADLLLGKGDFDQAIDISKRALELKKKAYGPDHPSIALVLTTIGNAYAAKGEGEIAIKYHEQALKLQEKIYGKTTTGTLNSLTNLGSAYLDKGDYGKAREYYLRVLQIADGKKDMKKIQAEVLRAVAQTYIQSQEPQKAIEYLQKSLSLQTAEQGKNGSANIQMQSSTFHTIGDAYAACREYPKAIESYQKAISILGTDESWQLAYSLNNLGMVYASCKNYPAAEKCFEKSLKIKEKTIGWSHISTFQTLIRLGETYLVLKDMRKAEQCFSLFLEQVRKEKKNTNAFAFSLNDIGYSFYMENHMYEKAIPFFQLALKIYMANSYEDRKPYMLSLWNLANTTRKNGGRYEDAIQTYVPVLAFATEKWGRNHPDTLTIRSMLGHALVMTGRHEEGIRNLNEALSQQRKILEKDHVSIAETYHFLGLAYLEIANKKKDRNALANARDALTKAWEIRKIKLQNDDWERKETEDTLNALPRIEAAL